MKQIKQNEKQIDVKISDLLDKLEKLKGPFKTKFDETVDSMNLKRPIYHKGALNGNDVAKLCEHENISKIANIFAPIETEINLATTSSSQDSQTMGIFGSDNVIQKVKTLLTMFSECYKLYVANRPLCRHEMETLAYKCCSFGTWFPTSFSDENLIRKFHVLTHHIPEKARRMWTVGMEAEQVIERIHSFVNKWNRIYATVQNTF